jgi:hypothetical protein
MERHMTQSHEQTTAQRAIGDFARGNGLTEAELKEVITQLAF